MTTSQDAQFSALLGTVYDAALDPALWIAVIEQSCRFLNCMGGVIGSYDIVMENGPFLNAAWGYEPKYLATINANMKVNPLVPMSFRLKAGEFGSIADGMRHEEFYVSQSHRDWSAPQGIIDVIQATLERTPMSMSVFAFSRHQSQGIVDDELRRRMALLVPHVRRAAGIGKAVDLSRLQTGALADTFDGLAAGVFIVDDRGGLLHVNNSGEAILAGGGLFKVVDRILHALQTDVDAALRAAFATAARGDAAISEQQVAFTLRSPSGDRFAAHVLPLRAGRRRAAGIGQSAAAALFVRKVAIDFPQPITTVVRRYRLTPAEARTLTVILAMEGVPAAAMMLGVSVATVKTHLRRIFNKTGSRRQADLVKLVAGHASPLAAGS